MLINCIQLYNNTPFPSSEARSELAESTGMTPRKVQVWFQNRRASMKSTSLALNPTTPASSASPLSGISDQSPDEPIASATNMSPRKTIDLDIRPNQRAMSELTVAADAKTVLQPASVNV